MIENLKYEIAKLKMETEIANNLAERIALILQEKETDNFTFLRSNLEKINERLNNLETKFAAQNLNDFHPSSFIFHPSKPHASQEKFEIAEAVAQEIIEGFEMEKPCPFEPTGKPCDHCSMCNSRGF